MKRFAVLLLALAMAVCCAMPAFAAGTIEVTEDVSVSDDYDWTRFKGQNVAINVYNWGEYISNGSDDSVDVVAAFEKLTGIKVNYTTFDSNESMYAKLKSGEANGYVTLVLSDKIRTLLKMIPLPKKMSKTPDQAEEFNVYSYLKQLIDGNDVSVLLRVADEAVSVMDVLHFYVPTIDQVSNGLRLALNLIRKYLPEGAFSRIYLDEQPVDGAVHSTGIHINIAHFSRQTACQRRFACTCRPVDRNRYHFISSPFLN